MTTHLAISAVLTIVVLALQLYCLLSLLAKLNETPQKFLTSLNTDEELYSTIRKWVDLFKLSASSPLAGMTTREHVKERIDDYVYSLSQYRFLQKLAVLAPVIGVMLTGLGFALLESQSFELGSLATPLAGGVLAGGFLAMTNQIVLHIAESKMIEVVDSMQHELALHWVDLARRHGEPTTHFREASARFDSAVQSLVELIGTFPANVPMLTSRFLEVEKLAKASVDTLQGLDLGLRVSADCFRDVSAKLATAASDEFISAVDHLQQTIFKLSAATDKSGSNAVELGNVTATLTTFSSTYLKEYAGLSRKMQELVEQSSASITKLVNGLHDSVTAIAEPMQLTASRLSNIGEASANSAAATTELGRVALMLKQFVETTAQPAKSTFEDLQRMSSELRQAYAGIGSVLESLKNSGADQMESQQVFLHLIKRRALPAVEVLQRATGTFEDSAQSIADSSEQLAEVLAMLNRILSTEEVAGRITDARVTADKRNAVVDS